MRLKGSAVLCACTNAASLAWPDAEMALAGVSPSPGRSRHPKQRTRPQLPTSSSSRDHTSAKSPCHPSRDIDWHRRSGEGGLLDLGGGQARTRREWGGGGNSCTRGVGGRQQFFLEGASSAHTAVPQSLLVSCLCRLPPQKSMPSQEGQEKWVCWTRGQPSPLPGFRARSSGS